MVGLTTREMSVFYHGDVYKILDGQIKDKSIDLIYIDPPFGTTGQWWDSKLNWEKLFEHFFRVLKNTGMLVIHCSIPFNYELIKAAPKPPSYTWYWDKQECTNYLNANNQPLRRMEEILVWKNKKVSYYRQQIGDEITSRKSCKKNDYVEGSLYDNTLTIQGKTRSNLISMKRHTQGFSTRPAELVKLMIDSYSKPGDTILDCFCYKGLSYTQSAGRKWVGIDLNFIPPVLIDGSSKESRTP